jgi:hypothetical protein
LLQFVCNSQKGKARRRRMSAWRAAGLTYVRYVEIAGATIRSAVKADLAPKIAKRGFYSYKRFQYKDGVQSPSGIYLSFYFIFINYFFFFLNS